MSNKTITLLSTIVMALSLPLAQARATTANTTSVADLANESQATNTLKLVQDAAASVASEADHLNAVAEEGLSRESNLDALMTMRDQVNQMGKGIVKLNNERDSLTPTEQNALDKLIPLAESIASNTKDAIEYFNQNGTRLGTAAYGAYAGHVFQDSQQISHVLGDSLKYEKLRAQQAKLQERVQTEAE